MQVLFGKKTPYVIVPYIIISLVHFILFTEGVSDDLFLVSLCVVQCLKLN